MHHDPKHATQQHHGLQYIHKCPQSSKDTRGNPYEGVCMHLFSMHYSPDEDYNGSYTNDIL